MVSTRRQSALGQSPTDTTQAILPQDALPSPVSATENGHPMDATTPATSKCEEIPGSPEPRSLPGGSEETTTSKPAPKRRKGKWSVEMKQKASLARETKKFLLRSFMQLPLDIILEMFSHLHPKALLSIARTSKDLRAMVLSPRHADLWKNAREEAGVPRPPEGFSEPRWASVLFDTNCCQVCWNDKDSDVDWYFLRRTCVECAERHTVQLPIPDVFTPYSLDLSMLRLVDTEVMQYIPWGRSVHWRANVGHNVLFWDDDAVDVLRAWQELSKHTDPAGRKTFHSWKMRRREIIQKNLNLIPTYQLWRTNRLYPSKRLIQHRQNRLVGERKYLAFEEIKRRLREAGHRTEDIEISKLLYPPYLLHSDTVSDEEWERMRPSFETDLAELKDFRVALEMELVAHERFSVFEEVYETFLDTLQPTERYRRPEVSCFRTNKDVVALLEASKDITVTRTHFRLIANKMQTVVDQAHNELKQRLTNVVPQYFATQPGQPWLLAEYVYTRRHRADAGPWRAEDGVLVGWDMIATHRHQGHSTKWLGLGALVHVPRAFDFNSRSSSDSRMLIEMASLPATVTVKKMDERDPRYVWEDEGDTEGLTVFTWRAALAHLYETGIRAASDQMRLATMEEKTAAEAFEVIARPQAKAWACNHCPQYLEASDADTKPAVLAHLAEKHGVTDPEMSRDYFVNERCRYTYEVPYRTQPVGRLDD